MARFDHVLRVLGEPWAILPGALEQIAAIVARRLDGVALSEEALAAVAASPRQSARTQGAIAVIPIHGVIANRLSMMSDISGGTSVDMLRGSIQQAEGDPNIRAIVFDVDSPGGTVHGVFELAELIRGLTTPTVAVINDMGASAAYALASAADEVVAAPSALVGSVGVVVKHTEESERLGAKGRKVTYIRSDETKMAASDSEPLSTESRADLQGKVDHYHRMFVQAVVAGRNAAGARLDAATVRDAWRAKVYTAAEALEIGMIDRIGLMDETLQRIARSHQASPMRASVDEERRRARQRVAVGA